MGDNITDARAAASIRPALRTTEQQAIVNRNIGDLGVKNNNHQAGKDQKTHGTK